MEQDTRQESIDQVDFPRLIRILWRWKGLILACVVFTQGLVVYKNFTTPKRYSTVSRFIFKEGQKANSSMGNLAMMMGLGGMVGGGTDLADFFDVILYTDDFLKQILDRKWMVGEDSLSMEQIWRKRQDFRLADTAIPQGAYLKFRQLVGKLAGQDYILVKKQGGIVNLTTQFEYPEVTYDVNLFIIEKLNDHLLNNTQSQARENRKFVEQRMHEVAAELRRSEESLLSFNLRNQNPSSPTLLLEMARLRRGVEVNQEIYLQLKKQLEMAKIEERKESPLIEVLAAPQLPLGPDKAVGTRQYALLTMGGVFAGIFLSLLLHFTLAAWPRKKKA